MKSDYKKYYFDVEIIIDHDYMNVVGKPAHISTHRVIRGIDIVELSKIIKQNQIPQEIPIKVTLNIRGVNY